MPARMVTSTVVGLIHSMRSAAQFCGSPSGPTRARRSHTSSVTHELAEPAMYIGLIATTGSAELSTICFWAPLGLARMKVQKLRMPIPLCEMIESSAQTSLLKAFIVVGCTMNICGWSRSSSR